MYTKSFFLIILLCNNVYSKFIFPSTFVKKVEKLLLKTYGEREVKLFRQMINDLHNNNSTWTSEDEENLINDIGKLFGDNSVNMYKSIINTPNSNSYEDRVVSSSIKLFKQEFSKLNNILKQHVIPEYNSFMQLKKQANLINNKNDINRKSDTVCNSPASCQAVESILNLCTNIRGGADFAYDNFSVAVHVLGSVMAVLCGCLFVGPVHVCVLKNFPYTCKLPFPVFNSLLIANSMIWEVTKLTSVICRVYGDPGISNTLLRYNN